MGIMTLTLDRECERRTQSQNQTDMQNIRDGIRRVAELFPDAFEGTVTRKENRFVLKVSGCGPALQAILSRVEMWGMLR